jgi:uncharacterized membrane protein YfbV (UPF0208 family)
MQSQSWKAVINQNFFLIAIPTIGLTYLGMRWTAQLKLARYQYNYELQRWRLQASKCRECADRMPKDTSVE